MEHLKENVEDLSDDKIFEEMIKIVQEKSLLKFAKINKTSDERREEIVRKNEIEVNGVVEKETGTHKVERENESLMKETEKKIGTNKVDEENTDCKEKTQTKLIGTNLENPVEIIVDDDESLIEIDEDNVLSVDPGLKSAIDSCYRLQSKQLQRCPYCPYQANHANHLRTHIPSIHSSFTCYRCPLCPAPSSNISKNSNQFTPPFFSHSQLSALSAHMDRKHRHKKFECPECEKKFTTLWNCEGHIAIRHVETAGKIQKLLRIRENLRKNLVENPGKIRKQCPYCEFKGASSNVVRKHVVGKHASWLVYKCRKCDFRAELVEDLREHVEEEHDEGEIETEVDEEEVGW